MSASHNHNHNHSHQHGKNTPLRVLTFAIILTFMFAGVEAVVGWWANSLALLSDAGHMATDSFALIIAAFAAWFSQRPPSEKHSYGLGRAEVVAAWISSLIILAISIAVIVEAVSRIHHPSDVKGWPVIIVAAIGLFVNLFIAWLLSRGERTLNVRAALLHVLSDVLGSIAALIAGAVIVWTGWFPIDPILSILIGVLITISSLRLLRESLLVLMEGVPAHININQVSNEIENVAGVLGIHDLHIWTLSSGVIVLSAHIHIHELSSWQVILNDIKDLLKQKYDIDHFTVQPEPDIYDCKPCVKPNGK